MSEFDASRRAAEEQESDDLALSPGRALTEHLEALSAWSGARVQAFAAAQQALAQARQAPEGAPPKREP